MLTDLKVQCQEIFWLNSYKAQVPSYLKLKYLR